LDYKVSELLFENDLPVVGRIEIAVKWKKSASKGTTREPMMLDEEVLNAVLWTMRERGLEGWAVR
jgi:hypothetical protein